MVALFRFRDVADAPGILGAGMLRGKGGGNRGRVARWNFTSDATLSSYEKLDLRMKFGANRKPSS
jgi:hypothetical protein